MNLDHLLEEIRKPHAKPGGGAVVIYIANMAVNLSLMMDKKNWGELENQANVSYETMIKISENLKKLGDDDIYYTNLMLDEFKKSSKVDRKFFIDAAKPQIQMNELCLDAMKILGFYLEHGKKTTISDGEIANELLRAAVLSSIPTIKINLGGEETKKIVGRTLEEAEILYKKNKKIIERRTL